jgi:hypothetical protein
MKIVCHPLDYTAERAAHIGDFQGESACLAFAFTSLAPVAFTARRRPARS